MRLQKWIAQHSDFSRRQAEDLIKSGKIHKNGKIATLGECAEIGDKITINGRTIRARNIHKITRVGILNKALGVICSRRPGAKNPSVYDFLPAGNWIMVGRLDVNTSGLLPFTNNGELAHRLMHPRYEIAREYRVRVSGLASKSDLAILKNGILLDGKTARFEKIIHASPATSGKNHWYRVVLRTGKKREVRRLWKAVGFEVSRLVRIRYGDISLPKNLKKNGVIFVEAGRVERLMRTVGLEKIKNPTVEKSMKNQRNIQSTKSQ